jgi:GNAT superfamily N-acetyltransferase
MTRERSGASFPTGVALRGADLHHSAELSRLRGAFIESQLPFGYRPPSLPLDRHVAESTPWVLASPHHHLVVAEDLEQGRLVAYGLGLRKVVPGLARGRIGLVEELYVEPDRRGTGVGRQLHSALFQRLTSAGVDRLEVQVLARNTPAVRFWQELGYALHLHVLDADPGS